MFEVVFGESEKSLINFALREISKDVVSIGYSLDIGDISGKIDGLERKNLFKELWHCVDFNEIETENYFEGQRTDMEKLLTAAIDGIPIRIWKSNSPYSICGFAFVCNLLKDINCKITVVSLPEYSKTEDNGLVSYSGWGEVPPSKLHTFLQFERDVTNIEKQLQSDIWQKMKTENAPLRAVVNGTLISVPENFYDHIIINNIPNNEFAMVSLIGRLLGKYQLGIGDGWYSLRIQKMIKENKLKIISDEDTSRPYRKVLKKV